MSLKGSITTAEPLDYPEFIRLLNCLQKDKQYTWELLCCVSFATAYRISDVLSLKWGEILDKKELVKTEIKTGKTRCVPLGESIGKRISELYTLLGKPDKDSIIICNQRAGAPFSRKHINITLKKFRVRYGLDIRRFSSHSFRKTFGRYVYEKMGRSPEALMMLCMIFQHSNPAVTQVYLGIKQDEINSVFASIKL